MISYISYLPHGITVHPLDFTWNVIQLCAEVSFFLVLSTHRSYCRIITAGTFLSQNLQWRMCIPFSGPSARSLARTHALASSLASALLPIRLLLFLFVPYGSMHVRTCARARAHKHTHSRPSFRLPQAPLVRVLIVLGDTVTYASANSEHLPLVADSLHWACYLGAC